MYVDCSEWFKGKEEECLYRWKLRHWYWHWSKFAKARSFLTEWCCYRCCARENKKVIAYKVFSKFCKSCNCGKVKKGTEEYIVWKENHGKDCEINHFQSSGAMESAGAQSFFQWSVDKYNIRYKHYIDYGDVLCNVGLLCNVVLRTFLCILGINYAMLTP